MSWGATRNTDDDDDEDDDDDDDGDDDDDDEHCLDRHCALALPFISELIYILYMSSTSTSQGSFAGKTSTLNRERRLNTTLFHPISILFPSSTGIWDNRKPVSIGKPLMDAPAPGSNEIRVAVK